MNLNIEYDIDSVLAVQIDGKILGYIENDKAKEFCNSIRILKINNYVHVPKNLEIAMILRSG